MTWRDISRPLVLRALQETDGQTEAEIRKALFDAYPFGARKLYPYKIWLSEVKAQRLLWAGRKRWEQGSLLKQKEEEPC